jgi:L-lactate dehydrogenase
MKLGIIGVGAVGAAAAMAVVLRARVRELVLIDKDRARARAVATDMHYGVPLSPLVTIKEAIMTTSTAPALLSSPPASTRRPAALPTGAIRLAGFVFSTPM